MWPSEIKHGEHIEIIIDIDEPKLYRVLSAVKGQMTDGIWENSDYMRSYSDFFSVEKGKAEGSCVINISKEYHLYSRSAPHLILIHNKMKDMGEKELLKWFAGKISRIADIEKHNCPNTGFAMEKDNDVRSIYLSGLGRDITGGELWQIHRKLLAAARGF